MVGKCHMIFFSTLSYETKFSRIIALNKALRFVYALQVRHFFSMDKSNLSGVYMGFWRVVFTIILPPLGVLIGKGFGWAFILNIILTLLGYFPGLIHAFWVQTRD